MNEKLEKKVDLLITRQDDLIRILIRNLLNGYTQKEIVFELSGWGFGPKDIAHYLNTTPNVVSVTLSKLKARK